MDELDRRLTLHALRFVLPIRVALWLLPYRSVLRWTEAKARVPRAANAASYSSSVIARAVRRASHAVPDATCLTQALAARVLLARYGHSAVVRIGVRRDTLGAFKAHAWTEVGGVPVIGGEEIDSYTPLPDVRGLI